VILSPRVFYFLQNQKASFRKSRKKGEIFIKKRQIRESLCWTCRRAYAKPDPDGCGFHRNGEAVYTQAEVRETKGHLRIIVRECPYYKISERARRDYEEWGLEIPKQEKAL